MLYLLDYGAGNVRSLANTIAKLGFEFQWIEKVEDFDLATKLLFPGVGAFGPAMDSLRQKGFFEPLKRYIASGRPYMGICIGMQALCEFSEEGDVPGLGILPASCKRFDATTKKVPHMGWNGAVALKQGANSQDETVRYGFVDNVSYYFVHSYQIPYTPALSEYALTATRYGEQVFVSSVQYKNVFGTQFHPEKSGLAGLNVLQAWLSQTGEINEATTTTLSLADIEPKLAANGLTKRIVACLDVRTNDDGDLVVTKGDQYDVREKSGDNSNVRNLGKPVELAQRYFDEGADEIAFLNITSFRSCPLGDQPMLQVVRQSAETIFVPLTIGGGIRDTVDPDGTVNSALDVAAAYFRNGADKVSIGSDAVFAVEDLIASSGKRSGKSSIETISKQYGAQAVVVSVDPKRVYVSSLEEVDKKHLPCVVDLSAQGGKPELGPNGERYCWYQCTVKGGRETRDIDVVQLCQGVEALGAGEILLNSVDRDGSKAGFDLRLVDLACRSVSIPVIASSGAGKVEDFEEVFEATGVEAALAAGIFHRKEVPLQDVKAHLARVGIPSRRDLENISR